MRRTLSSFVAILCLLTLFFSSAACLALPQNTLAIAQHHQHHTANTAEHACCPERSPAGEHTSTTCCTVHHQPVSASTAVELEQPGTIFNALPISIQISEAIVPSASAKLDTTQPPPLIALRI